MRATRPSCRAARAMCRCAAIADRRTWPRRAAAPEFVSAASTARTSPAGRCRTATTAHWKIVTASSTTTRRARRQATRTSGARPSTATSCCGSSGASRTRPTSTPNVPIIRVDGTHQKGADGKEIRLAVPDSDSGVYVRGSSKARDQHLGLAHRVRRGVRLPHGPEDAAGGARRRHAEGQRDRDIGQWNAFDHHEGRPPDGGPERHHGARERPVARRPGARAARAAAPRPEEGRRLDGPAVASSSSGTSRSVTEVGPGPRRRPQLEAAMDRRDFIVKSSAASLLACFPASLAGLERITRGRQAGAAVARPHGRAALDHRFRRHRRHERHGAGGVETASPRRSTTASTTSTWRRATATPRRCSARRSSPTARACSWRARRPSAAGTARSASWTTPCARMRTDHFDLYQLHAVTTRDGRREDLRAGRRPRDVRRREEGRQGPLPRILGALGRGGRWRSSSRFDFDTILFPTNFATVARGQLRAAGARRRAGEADGHPGAEGDGARAVAEGREAGHATRSAGTSRSRTPDDALMGLRFTLSHPVTAAIPPGDETLFKHGARPGAALHAAVGGRGARHQGEGRSRRAPLFKYPSWG